MIMVNPIKTHLYLYFFIDKIVNLNSIFNVFSNLSENYDINNL